MAYHSSVVVVVVDCISVLVLTGVVVSCAIIQRLAKNSTTAVVIRVAYDGKIFFCIIYFW